MSRLLDENVGIERPKSTSSEEESIMIIKKNAINTKIQLFRTIVYCQSLAEFDLSVSAYHANVSCSEGSSLVNTRSTLKITCIHLFRLIPDQRYK